MDDMNIELENIILFAKVCWKWWR